LTTRCPSQPPGVGDIRSSPTATAPEGVVDERLEDRDIDPGLCEPTGSDHAAETRAHDDGAVGGIPKVGTDLGQRG
jgi:hypothetical protein